MINQKLTQYPAWRLWPVHVAAKLFGVLVTVDGLPFGSGAGNHPCLAGSGQVTGSSSAECDSRLEE
ncbi:hypothetical protein D3C87_1980570 [compost metagenome]